MSEEAKLQQEPSMEEILASIRRIISEDHTDEAKSDDAAVEEGFEENDVLELTDVVEDEGQVQKEELAEEEAVEETEDGAPQSQNEIDTLFDEADPSDTDEKIELVEEEGDELAVAVVEEVVPEPEPIPVATPAPEGSLLDEAPAAAAMGSLSGLVAAVDAAHGTPIGNGNRTIEDLVKEVMRPMIKEWLDDNLSPLVERVVRREVERLSRTAEGED
jgi:cell pole-organizing protein PopZ